MLEKYFLLFISYSFVGWILEIILSIIMNKKFINRGFLLGPYCPIYGCGCILLVTLLSRYAGEPIALFALSMIVCSLLEYFTSWLMEIIFKMRWWDYSNEKFNINGRICLETMVPFGLIGVLVVKYINPNMINVLNNINEFTLNILTVILSCIFIIDIIVSSNIIFDLKKYVKDSKKDSTEDIKKHINKEIHNNKILYDRLVNAFPNFQKIVKDKKDKYKKKIKK